MTTALTTAVQEAKQIAAGGDDPESSWKSEEFASLKDLLNIGSDNSTSFVRKGEERSKLY